MTRRRKGHGHGGGGGGGGHGGGDSRWLVTYADLLTLLMVLFLVLWVISTIDLKKFEKFKSGLGDFGNPAAETSKPTAGIGEDATTTTIVVEDTGPAGDTTVPTEGTDPDPGGGDGSGTGTGAMLDSGELGGLIDGLQSAIDAAGLDNAVSVTVDQRGLVITVTTDDVLFAPGSADLEPRAKAVIGAVAPALADIGNSVIVEGYTDRRPIRRQGYDNWDLSVDRAVSVVKLLRDAFGLAPPRMAATGYGDQHPVAEGDDEASYARNRRVQIVVVPSGPGPDGTTSTAVSTAASP